LKLFNVIVPSLAIAQIGEAEFVAVRPLTEHVVEGGHFSQLEFKVAVIVPPELVLPVTGPGRPVARVKVIVMSAW
jgi:hypothetical protein